MGVFTYEKSQDLHRMRQLAQRHIVFASLCSGDRPPLPPPSLGPLFPGRSLGMRVWGAADDEAINVKIRTADECAEKLV